jgi:formylglycine-generating enzyme required for sulfatase activity
MLGDYCITSLWRALPSVLNFLNDRMSSNLLNRPRTRGLSRRAVIFGGLSSLTAGAAIVTGCDRRPSKRANLPSVVKPLAPAPFAAPAMFEFETVTTDERGNIVSRSTKQARYFTEELEPSKFLGIARHPKATLEMVEIPAGEFMMGSPMNEKNRDRSEGPQHRVKVPRFFMGRVEVTEAQWRCLMDDNVIFPKGENFPAGSVMWTQAQRFCRKLSEQTGRTYRLPSEAEWEYACRAGTTTPFYDGLTADRSVASNENFSGMDMFTTPVGCFPANAFGLHDLHGNGWEWEWCSDQWHDDYKGAPTNGSAWVNTAKDLQEIDPARVDYRVARGGTDWVEGEGWGEGKDLPSWAIRSAARAKKQVSVGSACFRVVCAV